MTTSPAERAPRAVSTGHALPVRLDTGDRSLGTDRHIAPPAGLEQPLVVERRVQFARPLDDHAAEIVVAGDLFALPLTRDHIGAGLRCCVEHGEPSRLRLVMLFRPCADKAAAPFPTAGNPFFVDQTVDQRERVGGVGRDALGAAGIDVGRPAGETTLPTLT